MMIKNEDVYFVWTSHQGQVWPEKWYGKKINSINGKETLPIFSQKLNEQEYNLTLDELSQKYPYKEQNNVS